MKKLVIAAIALATFVVSCKKDSKTDDTTSTVEKGAATINLNHVWGMQGEQSFELNKNFIHPMHGDTVNFSLFKYYISNVKLIKADGTTWTQPESYFLVDLSNAASLSIALNDVPVGTYSTLKFTLGVDSARNVSGAQTGALDVANKMFWSWNSGYIMFKAEGTYLDTAKTKDFAFHIGGFKSPYSVVTEKTIDLTTSLLSISKTSTSKIKFNVNAGVMFHTTPVKTLNMIHMPGAAAQSMGLDFFTHLYGFVFDKCEN